MSNARKCALRALHNVEKGMTVQAALEQSGLNGDDRRFVSDLVYGVLRTRLRLKRELAQFLPNIDKLPQDLLSALYLGVYALLFQDKARDHAIVNETVKLVRAKFGQRLGNLANAVLRRLTGQAKAGKESGQHDPSYWAMSESIAALWRNAYGVEESLALMRRSFQRPWSCLRVNLSHEASSDIHRELGQLPEAVMVGPAGIAFPPGHLPRQICGHPLVKWQKDGVISSQAAASQLILEKLGIYESWRHTPIWDACAGVGGKTFALAEQRAQVCLASDLSPIRLSQFRSDCRRLRLPNPPICVADAAQPPLLSWPGHILADVPCSGLGVLGRRPDIKERFRERDLARLLAIQERIVHSLALLLQPGRELAYMTCTLNPEENEGRIASLRKLVPQLQIMAEWQTPHDHPWLEGMYGCLLRRCE